MKFSTVSIYGSKIHCFPPKNNITLIVLHSQIILNPTTNIKLSFPVSYLIRRHNLKIGCTMLNGTLASWSLNVSNSQNFIVNQSINQIISNQIISRRIVIKIQQKADCNRFHIRAKTLPLRMLTLGNTCVGLDCLVGIEVCCFLPHTSQPHLS